MFDIQGASIYFLAFLFNVKSCQHYVRAKEQDFITVDQDMKRNALCRRYIPMKCIFAVNATRKLTVSREAFNSQKFVTKLPGKLRLYPLSYMAPGWSIIRWER